MDFWILDAITGEPVRVPDCLTWARWYEVADRWVARTELPGGVEVGTYFVGAPLPVTLDPNRKPQLYETRTRGTAAGEERSYATREAALAGHEEVVRNLAEMLAGGA